MDVKKDSPQNMNYLFISKAKIKLIRIYILKSLQNDCVRRLLYCPIYYH